MTSKEFRRKVQEGLSAEFGLGLIGTISGRTKDQNFRFDFGDSLKGVFVDILKSTIQNRIAIIQEAKYKVQLATRVFTKSNAVKYIVVFENELTDSDRKYFDENLISEGVSYYDVNDIEMLYANHFEKHNVANWYEVYSHLASLVYVHYKKCKSLRQSAGQELYKMLKGVNNFENENPWIEKFQADFGNRSIDPIHLFTSFNSNKLPDNKRIRRINLVLAGLSDRKQYKAISFIGCPTPMAVSLLASRVQNAQDEIWQFFAKIYENKRNGLKEVDFKKHLNWYGVNFSSLTQFLFWIESDQFLPIDINVRSFIAATELRYPQLNDYKSYKLLIQDIGIQNENYEENENYGQLGLFREIASVAYQIISQGKQNLVYTHHFQNWLSENKKDTKKKRKKIYPNPSRAKLKRTITNPNVVEPKPQNTSENISEISKLSFKLIAIKALDQCSDDYLNILKKNKLYYFEKTVTIEKGVITYFPENNIDIYSEKDKNIKLNFTAIVGKNGAGKSSLLELFFRAINNIAYANRAALKVKHLELTKKLFLELYYINFGYLYKITIEEDKITTEEFKLEGNIFVKNSRRKKFNKAFFGCFFYTIAVNYSHYALNSEITGTWLKWLFHKNDGYQTPLVINPMRTEGNIDINVENDLVKSRLIANLLAPVEDKQDFGFRKLTDNQVAKSIKYTLNKDKTKYVYTDEESQKAIYYRDLKINEQNVLEIVQKVFEIKNKIVTSTQGTQSENQKYIIKKLIRIAVTYGQYKKYFNQKKINFNSKKAILEYLGLLKNDSSHIAFKLKQAINYWKYPNLWPDSTKFKINIVDQGTVLQNFGSSIAKMNLIEYLPSPIFTFNILLSDINSISKKEVDFEKLSSGEKQFIHSISSILYHIKNIDSVKMGGRLISFDRVNVILDEIELYYHPELQQRYIAELISMIYRIDLGKVEAINFILATHSPYILSDISDNFVLKLKNGSPYNISAESFGANIHDLLTYDFLMENGSMGKFAKQRITQVIDYLQNKIRMRANVSYSNELNKGNIVENQNGETFYRELCENTISIVGEPILKNSLMELYAEAFRDGKNDFIDEQISKLKRLKDDQYFNS